jgi:hypothetical protein
MTHLVLIFLGMTALGIAWFINSVLKELRDRLARRIAIWILPDNQCTTLRAALLIAHAANLIAPRRRVRFRRITAERSLLSVEIGRWYASGAALAEIEADLRAERRILSPVRLVLPLLLNALSLRVRNAAHTMWAFVCWVLIRAPATLLLGILVTLIEGYAEVADARRHRHDERDLGKV